MATNATNKPKLWRFMRRSLRCLAFTEDVGYNEVVPQIYEEGNVEAHVFFDDEMPQVHCFDKRRDALEVEVIINLLTRIPDGYGEEPKDLPTPEFVVEAIQSVSRHLNDLWTS